MFKNKKKDSAKIQRSTKRAKLLSELRNEQKKGKLKIAIGIDIGTGNASVSIFEGGKLRVVESPHDGPQTPTIVFYDETSGEFHVGSEAEVLSYGDKGDNLFMHVKRMLFESPNERVYCNGKFSAIDVTAEILKHIQRLLLAQRPDLADYPQFGGSKKPEHELCISFTVPANWSVEQTTNYGKAIALAGFRLTDGFVAEPVAAARHASHLELLSLIDGSKGVVVDVGAGTSDEVIHCYERGVFHQEAAAGGNAYLAGHDFTNAIAKVIAREVGVNWSNVFDNGGLNLAKAAPNERPKIFAVWNAAEEAKKKLSVMEKASVPVTFPSGGRKMFSIDRKTAAKLWKDLFNKFRQGLASMMDDYNGGVAELDHIILVGGSAALPGLREEVAKALGCTVDRVCLCTGSEHAISNGAAEIGFYQNPVDSSLVSGLGFLMRDRENGGYVRVLLVPPGTIMPAEGYFAEHSNFSVKGDGSLITMPFVCRTGVKPNLVSGTRTILDESEILHFRRIEVSLADWPSGEHEVVLGITADANARLSLLVRPVSLPNIETVSIPLELQESGDAERNNSMDATIMLVLDCSSSMVGSKLDELKAGASKFVASATEQGAKVGICIFPAIDKNGEEHAKVLCTPTKDARSLRSAIGRLDVTGCTPMASGLRLAASELNKTGKQVEVSIAVLFTDGIPNSIDDAVEAATELKKRSRLITVGIGRDVVLPVLRQLASSPNDLFMAECKGQILSAFDSVAERIFSVSAGDGAYESKQAKLSGTTKKNPPTLSPVDQEVTDEFADDDWDDIEPDDAKEVA